MGFLDGILGARPKKNDAASLREAQAQAQRSLDQATARVAELERERGKLLRHGSVAEMESGEADLAAARLDVERLRALMATLAEEIPAAESAEALAALQSKIATAKRLRADFIKRWGAEYPGLAHKLVELLRAEEAAEGARSAAQAFETDALAKGVDPAAIEAAFKDFPGTAAADEMNAAGADAVIHLGSFGGHVLLPGIVQPGKSCFENPLWRPGGTQAANIRAVFGAA